MDLKLVLKGIWKKWKKLWEIISYIITKALLCIMYYTVFTLYALVAKLIRNDLLNLKREDNGESYRKEKEKVEDESYKQYKVVRNVHIGNIMLWLTRYLRHSYMLRQKG